MSWGLYFGVILILEKFIYGKVLKKAPGVIQHFYVVLLVVISFVLFNATTFTEAWHDLMNMFGFNSLPFITGDTLYNLRSYAVVLIVAFFAATPVFKRLGEKIEEKTVAAVIEPIVLAVILIVSTAYLVDGSFNPFLYFRF